MVVCTPTFKDFAVAEMRQNGAKVREYAQQTENRLLKSLALDVIEAAK